METWSYQQITSKDFLKSLIPQTEELSGLVDMEFSDGKIRVHKRQAFLNLFWFPIVTAFNIPLRKDHFIKYQSPNKDAMMGSWNKYYEEIMGRDPKHAEKLKAAIWEVLQDLYKFTSVDLLPYVSTIDILGLARIMSDPPMKEILDTKEKIKPEMGTNVIEEFIDVNNKRIMKLLGTKGALKCEMLLPYQKVRQLNKFQVPQTIYAFGVRTDVSDNIIGLPVVGSALEGLRNIQEYAVETLSAKKSMFYNNTAVSDSQYFGRKQHLLASSIQHIYQHDCKSKHLVRYNVTESNYQNLVGKRIYVEGKPITLTKNNVGDYVGQTIYMRSPITCRYRKGVCEVCGGRIFANIFKTLNVGILSAVHVIEPTTQKILSAKHLIKTLSLIYELPGSVSKILYRSSTNEIRWKPTFYDKLKKYKMGVPLKYVSAIHDVTLLRADKIVKEEKFSEIKHFVLKEVEGEKEFTYILENNKQIPFFSTEMLFHIRDTYNDLEIDDQMIWIPLYDTEKFPIFRTLVVNDNMLQFVSQVSNFLSDSIRNYTSVHEALQDFSNIIHSKVSANIVHLETLLKAYLVTSEDDFRVPRVDDPENVKFSTTAAILTERHVGTELAFQGLNKYVSTASTYLTPKSESPFDLFAIGMPD